jgi:hypothetical protein
MAKFIMIDHSLYGVGGHHYAYAVNVLRAAEAMGHEIVLISHRNFRPPPDLPESWRVVPTFTCDAYRGFSVFSGHEPLRRMASLYPEPKSLAGRTWDWLQANVNWRNVSRTHRRRVRQRRKFLRLSSEVLDEFARQCDEAFASVEVCAADTVFVPTLTEFDLKWIVTFLADRPGLASTPWHLQFHFNFLEGRESDFPRKPNNSKRCGRTSPPSSRRFRTTGFSSTRPHDNSPLNMNGLKWVAFSRFRIQ